MQQAVCRKFTSVNYSRADEARDVLSIVFDNTEIIPYTTKIIVEIDKIYYIYDGITGEKLLEDGFDSCRITEDLAELHKFEDNESTLVVGESIRTIKLDSMISHTRKHGRCLLVFLKSGKVVVFDKHGETRIEHQYSVINYGNDDNISSEDPIISVLLTNGETKVIHSSGEVTSLQSYLEDKFESVYWLNKRSMVARYKEKPEYAVIENRGTVIRHIPYSEYLRLIENRHPVKFFDQTDDS